MCFVMCYSAEKEKKKTSPRKNVKQIRRLEKCTHIYSKNVIYNRQNRNNPQTPVCALARTNTDAYILLTVFYKYTQRHTNTHTRSVSHTLTCMTATRGIT